MSGRWFWAEHPDSQRQKQKVLFSEKCWLNTLCPTIESCCGVTRCVTDPKRLLFPFIDLFILGWIDTVKPRVGQKKKIYLFFFYFSLKKLYIQAFFFSSVAGSRQWLETWGEQEMGDMWQRSTGKTVIRLHSMRLFNYRLVWCLTPSNWEIC